MKEGKKKVEIFPLPCPEQVVVTYLKNFTGLGKVAILRIVYIFPSRNLLQAILRVVALTMVCAFFGFYSYLIFTYLCKVQCLSVDFTQGDILTHFKTTARNDLIDFSS